ncbi:MAG: thermonuclease family protein [bacterium]
MRFQTTGIFAAVRRLVASFTFSSFFLASFALAFCAVAQADARWAHIDGVTDGDTVTLASGEAIRLMGIDAPEGKRVAVAQPFYLEAKQALAELVQGRRVKMVQGTSLVGVYGRTLAYLHLPDGTDVQREMLRRGYAMMTAYPPDLNHLHDYGVVEAEARRNRVGLWGHPYFAVQRIGQGAAIQGGPGRIAGVITAASATGTRVEITVEDRLKIQILHAFWQKFWPGQDAQAWIGQRALAQGRVKSKSMTMRIRHPSMLKIGAQANEYADE